MRNVFFISLFRNDARVETTSSPWESFCRLKADIDIEYA